MAGIVGSLKFLSKIKRNQIRLVHIFLAMWSCMIYAISCCLYDPISHAHAPTRIGKHFKNIQHGCSRWALQLAPELERGSMQEKWFKEDPSTRSNRGTRPGLRGAWPQGWERGYQEQWVSLGWRWGSGRRNHWWPQSSSWPPKPCSSRTTMALLGICIYRRVGVP